MQDKVVQLYSQTCECCGGIKTPPVINLSSRTDEIIDSVIQHVWDGKSENITIDRKSTQKMAEVLLEAVTTGYGSSLTDLVEGSADYNMLQALGRNAYVFSAAKDWQMCKAITEMMVEDGQLISFAQFRGKASAELQRWVGPWLETEYNHAIASSQMASKWVDFQTFGATKLRYLAVMDARTREDHRLLHNICRPTNDDFWLTWYPPNGWACRCNVISDSSGRVTDLTDKPLPIDNTPQEFRFNPGIKKVIFPPHHPYYQDVEKGNLLPALLDMPRKYQFDKIGNNLHQHIMVDIDDKDYANVRRAAEILAKENKVEILPIIKDPQLRENVIPGARKLKNPDIKIGDKYADIKTPHHSTYESVRLRIKDSLKQGNVSVIQLREDMDLKILDDAVLSKLKGEKRLEAVYVILPDGTLKSYKK